MVHNWELICQDENCYTQHSNQWIIVGNGALAFFKMLVFIMNFMMVVVLFQLIFLNNIKVYIVVEIFRQTGLFKN